MSALPEIPAGPHLLKLVKGDPLANQEWIELRARTQILVQELVADADNLRAAVAAERLQMAAEQKTQKGLLQKARKFALVLGRVLDSRVDLRPFGEDTNGYLVPFSASEVRLVLQLYGAAVASEMEEALEKEED